MTKALKMNTFFFFSPLSKYLFQFVIDEGGREGEVKERKTRVTRIEFMPPRRIHPLLPIYLFVVYSPGFYDASLCIPPKNHKHATTLHKIIIRHINIRRGHSLCHVQIHPCLSKRFFFMSPPFFYIKLIVISLYSFVLLAFNKLLRRNFMEKR